jgi:hypothetical protein
MMVLTMGRIINHIPFSAAGMCGAIVPVRDAAALVGIIMTIEGSMRAP